MDTSGDVTPTVVVDGALDPESAEWLRVLTATGAEREVGLGRLHTQLLRVALHEVRRRSAQRAIKGPELDDIAHQATADAMLSILGKLDTFRGESRFTTWIYKFVILEVSSKMGRHYWRRPSVPFEEEDWNRFPERLGLDPGRQAETAEMVNAVRRAIRDALTDHQRRMFVAVVLNGVPLDALVARLGVNRNAIYKTIFDARRKIRVYLVANGYLNDETASRKS